MSASRSGFLPQVLGLAGPYWSSARKWRVRGATLVLLLLTMSQVGLTVWGNYWNRALFDALEQRSVNDVLVQVGVFALMLAISIGVTAAHLIVKRWIQLDWRRWLTERLVGRWMEDGRHYRLHHSPGEHDNPDGRIAEDIRISTESAVALAHSLVFSVLILATFIDILWKVSGSLTVPGTAIEVAGYMVPLAFLYAGIGTLLGWMFGRPLVSSTNALQTAEATFRFGLARARERSESIALVQGEPMERSGARDRFARIVRDFDRQSLAFMGVVSFSTAYGALLPIFPTLVAAPQYIAGVMSLGVLMQAAQAFQRVTSALSWPVDNLGEIARCRASADRVLSLHESMRRLDEDATGKPRIVVTDATGPRLAIHDLTITEASGHVLVRDLSLEVRRGERVLVTGDPALSGSLFKAIGGLWPWGSGIVAMPEGERMIFMPERPFLPEGTLRDALCYPQPAAGFPDESLRRALESAGIGWLVPRLDASDNWEQTLALRAQQRVGFARALVQRPAWIVMEEATDAFDRHGERRMLEMLRRELPAAALLTISFHPGLEALHDRKIALGAGVEGVTAATGV
jgi:putative ATP-binding cassette transporter